MHVRVYPSNMACLASVICMLCMRGACAELRLTSVARIWPDGKPECGCVQSTYQYVQRLYKVHTCIYLYIVYTMLGCTLLFLNELNGLNY